MQPFLAVFGLAAGLALLVATLLAGRIGRAGFPLPPDDRRIGCVDGLRGYLALSVLIHHCFIWIEATQSGGAWHPPSIRFLSQLGTGSVGLFFMTTGLVFYPRILRGLRATSWPGLYVTRVFRIVPLIVFSVCAIMVVIALRIGAVPDRRLLPAAAEWISTWGEPPLLGYPDSGRLNAYVLWSLWYEWQFYIIVLPVCAGVMDLIRRREWPSWIVPAMLLVIGFAARPVGRVLDCPIGILFYLPLFAIGMLAYELRSRPAVRAALSGRWVALAAGAALLIGMTATGTPYLASSMPLFGFFFVCVACGNDLGGVLRGRGALVLGECSFGTYLLHGIVLDVLFVDTGLVGRHPSATTLALLLPVAAILVVAVTAVTYLAIERPAMRSGRSLAGRLAGRRVRLDSRELEVAP